LRIVKRRNKSRRVGRDLLQFLARSHVFPHVVRRPAALQRGFVFGQEFERGFDQLEHVVLRRCGGPADRAK